MGDAKIVKYTLGTDVTQAYGNKPGAVLLHGTGGVDDTFETSFYASSNGGRICAGAVDTSLGQVACFSALIDDFSAVAIDFSGHGMIGSRCMVQESAGLGTYTDVTETDLGCFNADVTLNSLTSSSAHGNAMFLGNKVSSELKYFTLNTSTGSQDFHGFSFQPDALIILGCSSLGNPNNTPGGAVNGNLSYGVGTANLNQWSFSQAAGAGTLGGVSASRRYRNDNILCMYAVASSTGYTQTAQRAALTALLSDGFTLNLLEAGTDSGGRSSTIAVLGLKINSSDAQFACGTLTQGATTLTAGFQPDAILFGSAVVQQATPSAGGIGMIGMSDGTTQNCSFNVGVGVQCGSYFSTAACIWMAGATNNQIGIATAAMTSTGATLTWSHDDGSNYLLGWFAVQTTNSDPYVPVVVTDPASSVGATTATLNGTVEPNTASNNISWQFDYGLTTAYGSTTILTGISGGFSPVAEASGITALTTGSTYHARILATDGTCFIYGGDISFIAFGSTAFAIPQIYRRL